MLNFYTEDTPPNPLISEEELNDQQVLNECMELKEELKDKLTILGHHYQNDDIISFADYKGDSLKLAQDAANCKDRPYIIFCGVHFMAETADMLTSQKQTVILPDLNAGCSMADMANNEQVEKCWQYLKKNTESKVVPITYINCTAQLKAFVGKNDGAICTSSNAEKIIQWAFSHGEKLLFFPDQHLGRNTCHKLGIPLSKMVVYNPTLKNGGLTPEQIKHAKVILWHGYCSVHQGFTPTQIDQLRKNDPKREIIVHPECSFDVVQKSDFAGSTSQLIEYIKQSTPGSKFAVGTEINLVNRLNKLYTDKDIISLSPYQCLCTTMYRVRPRWLLASLRSIAQDTPINVISVPEEIKKYALIALERMLNVR